MTQELFFPMVEFENDKLVWVVNWRKPYPLSKKLNPIWWFQNEWDPNPPDWSMPDSPMWLRRFNWWFRNPFHNFGRYVLGVGDQNYRVLFHKAPPKSVDHQPIGLEHASLIFANGKKLPWYFYASKNVSVYWGWQPTGFAGLKLNRWGLVLAPFVPFLYLGLVIRRFI